MNERMLKRPASDDLLPYVKRAKLSPSIMPLCGIENQKFGFTSRKKRRISDEFKFKLGNDHLLKELDRVTAAYQNEQKENSKLKNENNILRNGIQSLYVKTSNCRCENFKKELELKQNTVDYLQEVTFTLREQIKNLENQLNPGWNWQNNSYGGSGHVY